VHANLHAYFKLASNTILLLESGLKAPSATGGKRPRTNSKEDPRGSDPGSGSGTAYRSGSGYGTGGGSAAKRQKFTNRFEQRERDDYGAYGFYEDSYGVSGGSGSHGTRGGGGRHEYRHDKGGYYGSGNPRQQKDDNYFYHRGDYRGRRFQGRRPYGGGRGSGLLASQSNPILLKNRYRKK
jgi:hypothetical protein